MIKLMHGENNYESWFHYEKYRDKFMDDPQTQVTIINGDEVKDINDIFQSSAMNSFFETKKVLFIKRLFKNRSKKLKEKVAEFISKDLDYEIFFWEDGKADKRTKLYKTIKKTGEVLEFKNKKIGELVNWAKTFFEKESIKVESEALNYLVEYSNQNQMLISTQIKKVIMYCKACDINSVSKDTIKLLCASNKEESIWDFVDNISKSNFKKSLVLMESILHESTDYPYVLSMILRQIKLLYLVKKYSDMSRDKLASFIGEHPFAVRKVYNHTRNFTLDKLSYAYNQLINLDYKVKQGIIDPKLGLNLFVLSFR